MSLITCLTFGFYLKFFRMNTRLVFTIRQKLAIGYAVMFLSVLFISIYAVMQLNRLDRLINTALTVDSEILKSSEYLMNSLLTQASNDKKFMITGDAAFKKLFMENAEEFLARLDAMDERAAAKEQKDVLAGIRTSYQRYAALVNKEFQAGVPINRAPDSKKQELIDEVTIQIGRLNEVTQRLLDSKMIYSQQVSRGGTRIALFFTIIAVACGAGFGIIITRSLYIPLRRLKEGTQDISRGNFSKKIAIESQDEIGELSASFNQMCDRLRELDQLKSDFISNITHDLKTPLASITEANQLLLEGVGGAVSSQQTHLLRIIKEDAARLIRLIESIIDLSKMESGLQQYDFVLSDVAPVLAEAVEAMQLLAESKQITLAFTAAPDLPKLLLDRDKMVQALINLVSNAIKFTPAGGSVRVETRIVNSEQLLVKSEQLIVNSKNTTDYSLATHRNFMEISVMDTGPGIAAQDLPRIFDKFFQGQAGVQKKGSGRGLAIVQHIIQAHGGSIRAESQQPTGTAFYIRLPVHTRGSATRTLADA
jgi:two-component system sensor histidine kinase GlrK